MLAFRLFEHRAEFVKDRLCRSLLRAVAAQFGADLRTAALQFSAAPDVAAALIVGAHTEAQVLANVSSMQATIPPEFWAELKRQNLIEQNAWPDADRRAYRKST